MKALVTGGTGFVGSHLVELLVGRKWSVRCLERQEAGVSWLRGLPIECCPGDCCHPASLREAVKGVDVVFHLAGATRAVKSQTYFEINTVGTNNLLRACVESNPGIRAFVHCSSQAAAGPSGTTATTEADRCSPVSAYGESKRQSEELAIGCSAKIPVVVIRPSVVYGPRDRGLLPLFMLLSWGIRPRLAGRDQRFSLIYVKDLVHGLLLASQKEEAIGQVFFLSDGRDYGWKEIGDAFAGAAGRKAVGLPVPGGFVWTYAFLADMFALVRRRPVLLNSDKVRELVQPAWVCDNGKSRRLLGFEPRVTLEEGARLTFGWYKEAQWL